MALAGPDGLSRLLGADPDLVADPHPIYRQLRGEDPVHWSPDLNAWVVTRHRDVVAGLRDPRMSARRDIALHVSMDASAEERAAMHRRATLQMINSDPPEHGRRRGLVAASFHPRMVESVRTRAEEAAEALVDEVIGRGEMDLIADYAVPLPMSIISAILGFPFEDSVEIKGWADGVSNFLSSARVSRDEADRYLEGWASLAAYLGAHLADRSNASGTDVLSALASRIRDGDTDEEEAVANLVLLSVAGHETTTNSTGLAILTLLRHPSELARLRDDPSLIPSAVEELLRFEPTASWDFRVAREDIVLGGRRIRRGDLVNFVLTAANRDPAAFPDPDRLDLSRTPNRHMTFGQGAHFCLGSQLARLELQVAIATLLRRLASFEMVDEVPDFKLNARIRGLRSLRLSFTPAA